MSSERNGKRLKRWRMRQNVIAVEGDVKSGEVDGA
jgi:hypothetical protein